MTPLLARHTPVLFVVTEKPYRGVMTPLPSACCTPVLLIVAEKH